MNGRIENIFDATNLKFKTEIYLQRELPTTRTPHSNALPT